MKITSFLSSSLKIGMVGIAALALFACATPPKEKSLYERLGGKEAITAVVNELWAVVSKDNRINAHFAKTKPEVFGGKLVDFLCQASGGPCEYKGMDMKTRHTGMKITEQEFNAMAEDASAVLDKFKVPAKEKGEVMAMLGSLKGDIINR